jgi:TetR/AcrR family transcriptional repressor of bet genes
VDISATAEPRQRRLSHDERRRQIIETTLACLARNGAEGTSLRSVCREMRVAPSLVTHFFEGWHDLLSAAYQLLTDRFLASLSPLLHQEFPTARARMDEVIRRYLATDWIGENTVGANIALWQLSRTVVDLKAAFSRFLEDRKIVLRQALAELAAERAARIDLDEMTACLLLMLDGIWLEMSLNPGNIDDGRARQMCWALLDAILTVPAPLA